MMRACSPQLGCRCDLIVNPSLDQRSRLSIPPVCPAVHCLVNLSDADSPECQTIDASASTTATWRSVCAH
eukprot:1841361-Rhodomonas_salina.4